MNERSADVILSSEGAAFWVSHKTFESACLMDLTYYPFDEQSCVLWFQSLTSNSEKLVLEIYPPGFDIKTLLSDFREADTWEITASSAEVIRYPSDEGEVLIYSRRRSIRIRLTLKRRPGFTAYLLTVPCVVLSCMKLLVFALPAEGLERHSAGRNHHSDVIMGAMESQITSLTIVYSTVYSGAHQRKHQRSASLAFMWGIHRWPVYSPNKWSVTRKMFPFDDVIMQSLSKVYLLFTLFIYILLCILNYTMVTSWHRNAFRMAKTCVPSNL